MVDRVVPSTIIITTQTSQVLEEEVNTRSVSEYVAAGDNCVVLQIEPAVANVCDWICEVFLALRRQKSSHLQ